jgi:hypothetical protein
MNVELRGAEIVSDLKHDLSPVLYDTHVQVNVEWFDRDLANKFRLHVNLDRD